MYNKLTQNQKKVLDAIKYFIGKKGISPTFVELRKILSEKGMSLKSNNSILQYLNALEKKGFIQRFNKPRGIRILNKDVGNFLSLPLLGQADCGEALSFADDIAEDFINISKKYIKGNEQDYFFVKASGDSMNKSGINHGDLVLVRRVNGEPDENKDIVAVVNGLGTIKRFTRINGIPVLMPNSTNAEHQPIILHPDDQIYVAGVVERVFNFSTMVHGTS